MAFVRKNEEEAAKDSDRTGRTEDPESSTETIDKPLNKNLESLSHESHESPEINKVKENQPELQDFPEKAQTRARMKQFKRRAEP